MAEAWTIDGTRLALGALLATLEGASIGTITPEWIEITIDGATRYKGEGRLN